MATRGCWWSIMNSVGLYINGGFQRPDTTRRHSIVNRVTSCGFGSLENSQLVSLSLAWRRFSRIGSQRILNFELCPATRLHSTPVGSRRVGSLDTGLNHVHESYIVCVQNNPIKLASQTSLWTQPKSCGTSNPHPTDQDNITVAYPRNESPDTNCNLLHLSWKKKRKAWF
jgi:hypothetical protein